VGRGLIYGSMFTLGGMLIVWIFVTKYYCAGLMAAVTSNSRCSG